jgi:hypothetical protein
MKIGRVVIDSLRLPLPRPFRTSIHDIGAVDTVLVEMHGDAGALGSGYGWLSMKRYLDARAADILMPDLQRAALARYRV